MMEIILCPGCGDVVEGVGYRPYGTAQLWCADCRSMDGSDFERIELDDEHDDELLGGTWDDEDADFKRTLGASEVDIADRLRQLGAALDDSDTPRARAHLARLRRELGTVSVLTERLDYVCVWGHRGALHEEFFDTWEEAHERAMAAERNGATVAYAEERPISSIGEEEAR